MLTYSVSNKYFEEELKLEMEGCSFLSHCFIKPQNITEEFKSLSLIEITDLALSYILSDLSIANKCLEQPKLKKC